MKHLQHLAGGALLCALLPQAPAVAATFNTLSGEAPIIIAHRGVPAYLPENTIGGNELSYDMGADLIETDVQLTRDGVLVAMHDSTLDRTTNVAEVYAPRNGAYRVADFTHAELRALTVKPTGNAGTAYPGFTPSDANPYRIPTFAEMLDGINAYNQSHGTSLGILTELKYGFNPATNRQVFETLVEKGFTTADKSLVQSFDFGNVFDSVLLEDDFGIDVGIAQLGGASWNGFTWMVDNTISLQNLAQYADTVAISYGSLSEAFIEAAHGLGLSVYGWTYRPADLGAASDLMAQFLDWGLDGFITDNADLARQVIDAQQAAAVARLSALAVAPVPVPAALPLMGAGLGALALLRRRRARAA